MALPNQTLSIPIRFLDLVKNDIQSFRAFCLYVKLKRIYKSNGVIYNYSPATLSPKIKVSPYLISKYVAILIDLGIAQIHHGNLALKGMFKAAMMLKKGKRYRKSVNINGNDNLEVIGIKLRYLIIKNDIADRHLWYNNVRIEVFSRSLGSYNKTKKAVKKFNQLGRPELKEKCGNITHSGYRKLAKITGLSIFSIKGLLITLKKWHYLDFSVLSTELNVYINCNEYYQINGHRYFDGGYIHNENNTTIITYGTRLRFNC